MEIEFDRQIVEAAPELTVLLIEASVTNHNTSDILWNDISMACEEIRTSYPMDQIRHRGAIDATRRTYKALGKDPNRYRPSAEALCRRAVKGLDLYRSLTLIDLINLVSLRTGHSIGGFDAEKITGTVLTLGVGREGEPYDAIGRGELNIAGLPVYRDSIGGIGTPTSDNERTKLSEATRRLLLTVNLYGPGEHSTEEVETMFKDLLCKYADATDISVKTYHTRHENN